MRENSTEYARVIELMAKKLGKNASPEELDELAGLLATDTSYSWLAEVVASLKGNAEHVEKDMPAAEFIDSGWAHLTEKMNAGVVRPMKRSRVWAVAASFFVLAGLALWGYSRWGRQPVVASKSLQVGYGRKSTLVLADGTKVWLNAGSRLIYPAVFTGKTRDVELEGEAFFDVAQQAHQPFFVHTGKITVRVLGTRFDVKAYREDALVSATLISGKIQVILNEDPEKKILLSPHEKLTVVNTVSDKRPDGNSVTENELRYQVSFLPQAEHEAVAETAWVDNKLVFNNESFDEVGRQLERRYGVHIEFGNEVLRREHVTGVFEKESLLQALEILKMTTKFNYKVDSNQVRLIADQN